MAAINLTEVDFDQIKSNLIDYLKSTEQFTDYDFDGSNLQVILNLIAYQAQYNAYSTNMVANESFLASSTLRNNVVQHASNLGYLPVSARSATSTINLQYDLDTNLYPSGFPLFLQLDPGTIFSNSGGGQNLTFNIIDQYTAAVSSSGRCSFSDITVYEGTYLSAEFSVDKKLYNQRFVLDNPNIDSTTIRVEVQEDPNNDSTELYKEANNLTSLTTDSRNYWVKETEDGKYELIFGDGMFGKKLRDRAKVYVNYIVSSGSAGNGIRPTNDFFFIGRTIDSNDAAVTIRPTVTSMSTSDGGSEVEDVSSIKFRAPRNYATQSRCVIAEDYSTVIRNIYPAVDDIHVFGGEELDEPRYGRVYVIIKPTSGSSLSNITKQYIKSSLKDLRIASLDIVIEDPEILYVEVVSVVHYDDKRTISDSSTIISDVTKALSAYSDSSTVSKFGGAVRYSRVVGIIDDAHKAITRNNTEFRMRRDMVAVLDTRASYEICFENEFRNYSGITSVYSTGFQLQINGVVDERIYYFEDDSKGNLYRFYLDSTNNKIVVDTDFGTVDYVKGEVKIGYQNPITIVNTTVDDSVVQIRAIPKEQDVIAKRTVYSEFDISSSNIVAVIDQDLKN